MFPQSGRNSDNPAGRDPFLPVLDRVFHQRLKDEFRHAQRHQLLRHIRCEIKCVCIPQFLKFNERFRVVDLLPQFYKQIPALDIPPEQVAEQMDHLCRIRVLMFQRVETNRFQRIKQEMRVDLRLQRFQFGSL